MHPGLVPTALKFARTGKARGPQRPGSAGRPSKEGNRDRDKVGDRDVDEAEDVDEERARKLVRLGGMLRSKQRFAAAAVEYTKAQRLVGPGHVVVAGKLARALLALGDTDGAIAAATPAWELYPEEGGICGLLGEAWMKKGDRVKAATFLEAALQGNPFDPAPHCALATLYDQRSDGRAAREHKACAALKE